MSLAARGQECLFRHIALSAAASSAQQPAAELYKCNMRAWLEQGRLGLSRESFGHGQETL